jgi:hypothetical protein
MKKQTLSIAIAILMMAIGTTTYAGNRNPTTGLKLTAKEKVEKNFNKQFQNSADPSIAVSKEGFIAQSKADDHNVTVAYDKKGNWLYTLKFYPTENLAKNIIEEVKRNYDNYYITNMEEVTEPAFPSVFIVHMENDKSFKTLRVVKNDVELIKDVKRG